MLEINFRNSKKLIGDLKITFIVICKHGLIEYAFMSYVSSVEKIDELW